jgi:hypothetical protein
LEKDLNKRFLSESINALEKNLIARKSGSKSKDSKDLLNVNNAKSKTGNSPVSSPTSKSPRVGVGNKSPFFGGDNPGALVIKSPRGGTIKEVEVFKEEKIDRENQANSSIKKVKIFLCTNL